MNTLFINLTSLFTFYVKDIIFKIKNARNTYYLNKALLQDQFSNQTNDQLIEEIRIIWDKDDIREVRPDLNDEEVSTVLKHLKKNHDASIGVNWEVINVTSDILFPQGHLSDF